MDTASVKSLVQDPEGNVWIASWAGLYRWQPATGDIRTYRHREDDPHSLSSDGLTTIHVGQDGTIWVGADSDGLNRYRVLSDDFERHFAPERGLGTVSDIAETTDGYLWLASFSGLVRFDPRSGETRVFGRREGLPNQQIGAIVALGNGVLWLSTGFGMASFDPQTLAVRAYDTRDGLPDNTVKFARLGGSDGRVYFGGEPGLVVFDPSRFVFSDYEPPVVITDIEVSDKLLRPGAGSPLLRLAHLTETIELPYDRNDVGFSFAALVFNRPDQNQYLYRLDGVDDDWRDPETRRRAGYTDLRPGQYTFRVRASNHDGVWTEVGTELELVIRPPWWKADWAKGIYTVLAVLAMWVIYRQITLRERMRGRLAVQRAESRKLQEIDELKTRFLTNITHEFRTPLTLIRVPLQRLQRRLTGDDGESVETMVRNADRLEQLIDQVLDLSRLEAGRLPLNWEWGDCLAYIETFAAGFATLAGQRAVTLTLHESGDTCDSWFDADLLEKLVGNLLTNAVKHTPDGGEITVHVQAGASREGVSEWPHLALGDRVLPVRDLTVSVLNTGSFIPPSEQEGVFDRFHQSSAIGGAGVGLSLVRELATWLGGQVVLISDQETGTRFTVRVPVFLEKPDGIVSEEAAEARTSPAEESEETEGEAEEGLAARPRILLVEDNQDLRSFMARDLGDDFTVLEAHDGEAGVAAAVAEIPDLVLSDVMMPGIDGFELCRRLKEDPRTSHVPIILLTARAEAESRHQGLRLGADDYLSKPFNTEDLRLRIGNLIDQRRKLAEKYERLLATGAPEAMPIVSADDRFLAGLREVVEENLDNPDFSVGELCSEAAMSRSQLHRKLTALTGRSGRDFIRIQRLRRAAVLMEGGYGNVTEVAYAVGFRSLSHFSHAFREFHGVNPSEFLRNRPIPEQDG